jgi:chorismate dehydratase
VRLHFRSGLRSITRLAVDPSSSAEIVLARILLAEEFESRPEIMPHGGPLKAMLSEADAALVVGGTASGESEPGSTSRSLDLVEAWQELTDLPYVYGLWCAYERALSEADARRIQEAHQRAQTEADHLRAESPAHPLAAYHYSGQARVEESVRELLHYVYYHGILPDVPELEYYVFGAADRSV